MYQSCLQSDKYDSVNVGYMFHYALTVNSYNSMMKMACILSKEEMGCDTLSVYEMMDHKGDVLKNELGFFDGDCRMHYYLYNFSIGDHEVLPKDVAALML